MTPPGSIGMEGAGIGAPCYRISMSLRGGLKDRRGNLRRTILRLTHVLGEFVLLCREIATGASALAMTLLLRSAAQERYRAGLGSCDLPSTVHALSGGTAAPGGRECVLAGAGRNKKHRVIPTGIGAERRKWNGGIFAPILVRYANRCEDPSTRFARSG